MLGDQSSTGYISSASDLNDLDQKLDGVATERIFSNSEQEDCVETPSNEDTLLFASVHSTENERATTTAATNHFKGAPSVSLERNANRTTSKAALTFGYDGSSDKPDSSSEFTQQPQNPVITRKPVASNRRAQNRCAHIRIDENGALIVSTDPRQNVQTSSFLDELKNATKNHRHSRGDSLLTGSIAENDEEKTPTNLKAFDAESLLKRREKSRDFTDTAPTGVADFAHQEPPTRPPPPVPDDDQLLRAPRDHNHYPLEDVDRVSAGSPPSTSSESRLSLASMPEGSELAKAQLTLQERILHSIATRAISGFQNSQSLEPEQTHSRSSSVEDASVDSTHVHPPSLRSYYAAEVEEQSTPADRMVEVLTALLMRMRSCVPASNLESATQQENSGTETLEVDLFPMLSFHKEKNLARHVFDDLLLLLRHKLRVHLRREMTRVYRPTGTPVVGEEMQEELELQLRVRRAIIARKDGCETVEELLRFLNDNGIGERVEELVI